MNTAIKEYVICVRNEDYAASLEIRKVYEVLPDPDSATHGMIRLIDESGEDYLYPENFFLPITLPESVSRALVS